MLKKQINAKNLLDVATVALLVASFAVGYARAVLITTITKD